MASETLLVTNLLDENIQPVTQKLFLWLHKKFYALCIICTMSATKLKVFTKFIDFSKACFNSILSVILEDMMNRLDCREILTHPCIQSSGKI